MEEQIRIGYARVSEADDRQKLGLEVQKRSIKTLRSVVFEKQSGSDDHRPSFSTVNPTSKRPIPSRQTGRLLCL